MHDLTAMLHETMPLCATLGLVANEFTPETVQVSLDWDAELCTGGGVLHGGVLMALADSAGAALAMANLPAGAAGTTTIESKTNFLRGVSDGTVVATSTPLHVGRTTIVIETELRNDDRLVAKVTQTQAVLAQRT